VDGDTERVAALPVAIFAATVPPPQAVSRVAESKTTARKYLDMNRPIACLVTHIVPDGNDLS
jgi:hypothetical protein